MIILVDIYMLLWPDLGLSPKVASSSGLRSSPLRLQVPSRLCCSTAIERGLTVQVGWKIMPLAHATQGKCWLYPRAQPSQAPLKLLDLLSILLILKENKLHKWDRWFLFVMTVAILSSPPPPNTHTHPSRLSFSISLAGFLFVCFVLNWLSCATWVASKYENQTWTAESTDAQGLIYLIYLNTNSDDPFDPRLWHKPNLKLFI